MTDECIRFDLAVAGFGVLVDFDNRFEMHVLDETRLFQAGGIERHDGERQNMEQIHIHIGGGAR